MTASGTPEQVVHNVVLGEASPGAVLAAISLARRIPGGAALMFATRDDLAAALRMPAHRERARPYRLHVVGPDLIPEHRDEILAAFRDDPKHSLHWYDANIWTPADTIELDQATSHGSWFNVARTHHPFPAIEAAARSLGMLDDPFSAKLVELAEERLSAKEEAEWGRPWRDTLESLTGSPLALIETVRPLLHGMPAEMGTLDRGEGDALRSEIDGLLHNSRLMQIPVGEGDGLSGKAVLLVLPEPRHQPATPIAIAAMAATGCNLALILYDRGDRAMLVGRRHGASPPLDVRPAFERLLRLPFAHRDRLLRGYAQVRLVDPPKDALERLVAGLL